MSASKKELVMKFTEAFLWTHLEGWRWGRGDSRAVLHNSGIDSQSWQPVNKNKMTSSSISFADGLVV